MKIISRNIEAWDEVTKGDRSTNCQASFNSDGVITLRSYNSQNKHSDDIVVFTREETLAIIELFSRISTIVKNNNLPF